MSPYKNCLNVFIDVQPDGGFYTDCRVEQYLNPCNTLYVYLSAGHNLIGA